MYMTFRMKYIIASITLILLLSKETVLGQPNPDVCIPGLIPVNDTGTDTMTLPVLPDQYTAVVEGNFLGRDFSMEVTEYYDGLNNRGAAVFSRGGHVKHVSYDYKHSQKIEVDTQAGTCTVDDLTKTSISLYGFHKEHGQGHINSVADILRFGDHYNDTYIGTDIVRGIPVDHWQGCVYNNRTNSTYMTDFYFTVKGYKTISGDDQIPVRMTINGTAQNVTFSDGELVLIPDAFHTFYHVYDFFSFRSGPALDEFAYQPLLGYVCPGRNSSSPMPPLPQQFSVSVESVNKHLKTVHFNWEQYDYVAKLVRFYFLPNNDTTVLNYTFNPFDWDPVEFIHDYNTGIQYMLDPVTGNCSMSQIYKDSFDAMKQPDGNVTMRDVSNYFHLAGVNWTYEGMALIRDIDCHAWIAERTDWPEYAVNSGYQVNSTWEYFFADSSWSADGAQMKSEKGRPLRLEIRATWMFNGKINKTHDIFNMYHFKEDRSLRHFDISTCYTSEERKTLAFLFNGPNLYKMYVLNNTRQFHIDVRNSIASQATVSALRVVDVYADEVDGKLKVWFTLLDKPNITGDVTNVKPQLNLTEAYNTLKTVIDSGTMTVTVTYQGKEAHLNVKSESLVEDGANPKPPEPGPHVVVNKGYSSGSMAGIAIAMLLIGAVVGLGIGFFIWKRQGAFSYEVQE